MTAAIVTFGRYRAIEGSPAAEKLAGAEVFYAEAERLTRALQAQRVAEGLKDDDPGSEVVARLATQESAAWSAGKRCEREASALVGFAGEAVNDALIETATNAGAAGRCDPAMREGLVARVAQGENEAVARRSVIRGLLIGANPAKAREPAPAPPPPPTPKRSKWDGVLPTSAA